MPSFRKRNGSWQAIVKVDGKQLTKTFRTKHLARDWATDIEEEQLLKTQRRASDKSMSDIMQKYLDEVVPTLADPKKETSYIKFLMSFDWMMTPLHKLSTEQLVKWRDERYWDCSAKTVHTNFTLFKTALRHAKQNDVLELFQSIALKRVTGRVVPRLTEDNEKKLRLAAEGSHAKYLPHLIDFALATGMRRGETLKLDWGMVDLEGGWLNLPGSITKTGQPRQIFITERCKKALNNIKALTEAGDAVFRINPFFKTQSGKERVWPVTIDALRKTFTTARIKAELESLHWHDLRHEAISRWFDMGLTTPEVQFMSGHRTIEELSRYSHASTKSVQQKLMGV